MLLPGRAGEPINLKPQPFPGWGLEETIESFNSDAEGRAAREVLPASPARRLDDRDRADLREHLLPIDNPPLDHLPDEFPEVLNRHPGSVLAILHGALHVIGVVTHMYRLIDQGTLSLCRDRAACRF
jgi:hypothetical protein